ncbi:hypothetical protein PybrP1_002534 [[Pythium] brassicae (nom. inval.)]|nr:hypothetical protein PybrP1_002534 [[Pythium] brassicae (nom. inval.)]
MGISLLPLTTPTKSRERHCQQARRIAARDCQLELGPDRCGRLHSHLAAPEHTARSLRASVRDAVVQLPRSPVSADRAQPTPFNANGP